MSFTIARRFLFLSTQSCISSKSSFWLQSVSSPGFCPPSSLSSSSLRCFPQSRGGGGKKWRAKKIQNLFPREKVRKKTHLFVCCMSSLLLRKSTWTTTTTFFRQHTVVRFGARRAMSSSSSGMMPRPLVSSMMGHTPRGRASSSSSSSSINAKTTLRRGERVRTFAFGARKAPKGQLPEREPSMGLDPENAQAKVKHTHTHTHTERERERERAFR